MKVILIHGAPSVGKFTISKEIQKLIPAKLLHNHLIVDLALSIYNNFGEKDFFDFNQLIRLESIKKAKDLGVEIILLTFCYSASHDKVYIKQLSEHAIENCYEILPVFIEAEEENLMKRVLSKERIGTNKIHSLSLLAKVLKENSYESIESLDCFKIKNDDLLPNEAAKLILNHFKITSLFKN